MEKADQVQIMEKLVEQPLVAGVDASTWYEDDTWRKDVIHSLKPPSKSDYCLTHSIVIVGYGKSKTGIPIGLLETQWDWLWHGDISKSTEETLRFLISEFVEKEQTQKSQESKTSYKTNTKQS
ncbi:hypothetical protein A2U01_0009969 [Trifolium medium]|uniref:Uncharacterized protein n=1 Tax=Trifolium medium TaxID=97028 RepID=A0A392MNG3_9FABA|nr:hypothetical protein [Trifolium medium]